MRKLFSVLLAALLILPAAVMAASVGTGVTPDITTEDFPPMVWMCDHRVVYDDFTEPGRYVKDPDCVQACVEEYTDSAQAEACRDDCREVLMERLHNYAFEGEQIQWKVLVMDKNGIEKLEDVFATVGPSQGAGNDIEVDCKESTYHAGQILDSCNARIGEEKITKWDSRVMRYYECTLTVETYDSMNGEYFITVEATDLDGLSGTMDENEYWFLNPIVALSEDGVLMFEEVRPGSSSYSDTILVGNDAEAGSGVMLDMFVSGTDFYDSSSSGAMCPDTNQLALTNFRYFATSGAYSTEDDDRADNEGYVGINYGIGFNNPNPFYDNNEIIQSKADVEGYYLGNVLSPGSEMALTFRLDLPEPCNGDFDTGSIYFWGEAI